MLTVKSLWVIFLLFFYSNAYAKPFPILDLPVSLLGRVFDFLCFKDSCLFFRINHHFLKSKGNYVTFLAFPNFESFDMIQPKLQKFIPPDQGYNTRLLSLDLKNTDLKNHDLEWIALNFKKILDLDLSVNSSLTDSIGTSLLALNLKNLYLGGTEITDQIVPCLMQLTQLDTLSLDDVQISAEGFLFLTNLTGLRSLNLAETEFNDAALSQLMVLTRLTELDIEYVNLTEQSCHCFPRFSHLVSLNLSGNQHLFESDLSSISKLMYLGSLFLYDVRLTDQQFENIIYLKNLIELGLKCNRLTANCLFRLSEFSCLTSLDLVSNQIQHHGLSHFLVLTKLINLELGFNLQLGGDRLTDFRVLKHLIQLDLSRCGLRSENLSFLPALKELEILAIGFNEGIRAESLDILRQITSLSDLDLRGIPMEGHHLRILDTLTHLKLLYIASSLDQNYLNHLGQLQETLTKTKFFIHAMFDVDPAVER